MRRHRQDASVLAALLDTAPAPIVPAESSLPSQPLLQGDEDVATPLVLSDRGGVQMHRNR